MREKLNVYDKIVTKNPKKRKYGNQKHFYSNFRLKDDLKLEFVAN